MSQPYPDPGAQPPEDDLGWLLEPEPQPPAPPEESHIQEQEDDLSWLLAPEPVAPQPPVQAPQAPTTPVQMQTGEVVQAAGTMDPTVERMECLGRNVAEDIDSPTVLDRMMYAMTQMTAIPEALLAGGREESPIYRKFDDDLSLMDALKDDKIGWSVMGGAWKWEMGPEWEGQVPTEEEFALMMDKAGLGITAEGAKQAFVHFIRGVFGAPIGKIAPKGEGEEGGKWTELMPDAARTAEEQLEHQAMVTGRRSSEPRVKDWKALQAGPVAWAKTLAALARGETDPIMAGQYLLNTFDDTRDRMTAEYMEESPEGVGADPLELFVSELTDPSLIPGKAAVGAVKKGLKAVAKTGSEVVGKPVKWTAGKVKTFLEGSERGKSLLGAVEKSGENGAAALRYVRKIFEHDAKTLSEAVARRGTAQFKEEITAGLMAGDERAMAMLVEGMPDASKKELRQAFEKWRVRQAEVLEELPTRFEPPPDAPGSPPIQPPPPGPGTIPPYPTVSRDELLDLKETLIGDGPADAKAKLRELVDKYGDEVKQHVSIGENGRILDVNLPAKGAAPKAKPKKPKQPLPPKVDEKPAAGGWPTAEERKRVQDMLDAGGHIEAGDAVAGLEKKYGRKLDAIISKTPDGKYKRILEPGEGVDRLRKEMKGTFKKNTDEDIEAAIALMEANAKYWDEPIEAYIDKRVHGFASGRGETPGAEAIPEAWHPTARASHELTKDGKSLIRALKNPSRGSLFHELGHMFHHNLKPDDLEKVLKVMKHKRWNAKTSERFAEQFHRYLAHGVTGTTPKELVPVFERFREWVANTYYSIKESLPGLKTSRGMREIYDTMLQAPGAAADVKRALPEKLLPVDKTAKLAQEAPTLKSLAAAEGQTNIPVHKLRDMMEGMSRADQDKLMLELMDEHGLTPAIADIPKEQIRPEDNLFATKHGFPSPGRTGGDDPGYYRIQIPKDQMADVQAAIDAKVGRGAQHLAEARPRPVVPAPPASGAKTYDEFITADLAGARKMSRETRQAFEENIKVAAGTAKPLSPSASVTTDQVIDHVAKTLGPEYRKMLDDLLSIEKGAGISVDPRDGYVMHKHMGLREHMDAAAKRHKDRELGPLWKEQGADKTVDDIVRAEWDMSPAELHDKAVKDGVWYSPEQWDAMGHSPESYKSFGEWYVGYMKGAGDEFAPMSGSLAQRLETGVSARKHRGLRGTIGQLNTFFDPLMKKHGIRSQAFESDVMMLMTARAGQTAQAVGQKRGLMKLMDEVALAPTGAKGEKSVLELLQDVGLTAEDNPEAFKFLKDKVVPGDVVEDLNKALKVMADPEMGSKALKAMRVFNSRMQMATIAPFPKYYKLNFLTGVWQNMVWGGGLDEPLAMASAYGRAHKFQQAMKAGAKIDDDMAAMLGISRKQLDEMIAHDIQMPMGSTISTGRAGMVEPGLMPDRKAGTIGLGRRIARGVDKPIAGVAGKALKGGAELDNMHRIAQYLRQVELGKTGKEAAGLTDKIHFPVDVLTAAERGTAKRMGVRDASFFYSWPRHSIPFTLKTMSEQPQKYWRMLKAARLMGAEKQYNPEDPEWRREYIRFYFPGAKAGEKRMFYNLRTMPEELLTELSHIRHDIRHQSSGRDGFRLWETIASKLGPLFKTPAEKFAGRAYFKDRPIADDIFFRAMPADLQNWVDKAMHVTPLLGRLSPQPVDADWAKGKGGKQEYYTVRGEDWHTARTLIPPLGRFVSEAQTAHKDPIAWMISQVAPGSTYVIKPDMDKTMRGKKKREFYRDFLQPTLEDAGLVRRGKKGYGRGWTDRGNEEKWREFREMVEQLYSEK